MPGLVLKGVFKGRLDSSRNTSKEAQCIGQGWNKLSQTLIGEGFHVGVLAVGQCGHEDLTTHHLSRVFVNIMEFVARKINLQYIPWLVGKDRCDILTIDVMIEPLTELGIPISVCMALTVFLPE